MDSTDFLNNITMNTIKENWKPIDGFEDYAVSNLGKVKSLKYGRERILKPMKNREGYLQVQLWKNGKRKMFKVHRLVATAFIPNPMDLPEINHRNEDKANNIVGNLEFCSRRYNINFGTHNVRMATTLTNHPAFSKAVEASKFPDFRTIELRFASTAEAGRNGFKHSAVSCCCNGRFHREGNNKYKKQ